MHDLPIKSDFERLRKLFNPSSIALVGVPRSLKSGSILLTALLDQDFPGPLYPINPKADEIEGLKAYPSLGAVEGPIDAAILMVPSSKTVQIMEECAAKGVKLVVLYTAGYREKGTEEGRALEQRVLEIARSGGIRLLGPNCMGIYAPESHLSNYPKLSKTPGKLAFIAQSGSLTNMICSLLPLREMFFSMAVSTGNEIDLNSSDFLEYLAQDKNTELIVLYLEGISKGTRFHEVVKETAMKKPVLIWKVGMTNAGKRAVLSHTGSMMGSRRVWESMFKQTGAIGLTGIEDLIDVSTAFYFLPDTVGPNIGIVSAPGSLAVAAAEACERHGLRVAELGRDSIQSLSSLLPETGTSTSNPVDLGFSATMDINYFRESVEVVGRDASVDALFIIGGGLTPDLNREFQRSIADTHKRLNKPIIAISLPGLNVEISRGFFKKGVPVFESVDRAAAAYEKVLRYQTWKRAVKG
ncbi:MAG: CoA-binding protein [Desulfatiglans sp.]|jgi:acetyltransferase|nr:CoA-binding protein [Thermodesulfobacteriota bacterium]MEE4354550.1 CoA-binding protein [Desulfatiglans sp.]